MKFQIGTTVFLQTIKKEGIVERVLKNNRYRVRIGAMVSTCAASDLQPVQKKESSLIPQKPRGKGVKQLAKHTVQELDLHGYTVANAEEAILNAINDAILRGDTRLHLVHGHGTGKVQAATHRVLSTLDVIKRFEISRTNSGMTVLYL